MASGNLSCSWNVSSANQKNVRLPDRFLCRECKKLKSPLQFSNKELNGYRWKKTVRIPVNHITADLRCRTCTGDQTEELHCTGPCALWKGLNEFSKNQRRRPENAWCLSCTQWKEANEPGVTPLAAPNNVLSPDEEREVAENEAGFGTYACDNIEGEADSDDDGNGFIYDSFATMSIGDNSMPGSSGQRGEVSRSHAAGAVLPGYLAASRVTSSVSKAKSFVSNPYDNRSNYSVEGGNSQWGEAMPEISPSGKTMEYKNQQYSSGFGRRTTDAKRPGPGISYKALDNSGRVHSESRHLSQSTAVTGSIGILSRPDGNSGSSSLACEWAKQVSGNPPPQFPALTLPIKQINYEDDDDSPDEL